MESIMATDMTGNVNAWCSLQDKNSMDWREQCRFYLCTFMQLMSSISSYDEELNKAMYGRNVKDLSTYDLQTKSKRKQLELSLLAMPMLLLVLLEREARVIRTRWWSVLLTNVARVGLVCFYLFIRTATWLFPDGYEPISLLLGFDSRDLIIPSCYVVHSLAVAICLKVDRRCSYSSLKTYIYTDIRTINQCISFLRGHGAHILAVFNRRFVSSTSFTDHHTSRPESHTRSKKRPFVSCLRGRGVKYKFNPSFVTSWTVLVNRQRHFQRKHTEENSDGSLQPNCSKSNENGDDLSAEIPSNKSSLPDTGSRRRDSGDDSYENALSCFASPKNNYSDGKEAEVSPNSSRSSSPDTYSRRGYTGDVGFATKANSSDGDEADVSADTTPAGSRSSSPDTSDDRGRCTYDDIPTDATAASWISSPLSTYNDKGKREVPAKEDFASENSSSTDSDLQQEDVSGSLQETASLCSSSTFFRPIRHDGGQKCGLPATDLPPGPSSPPNDFQVCEKTDENVCSSRGKDTDYCSPLIPCTETNSRTEDKPHCVVPDSSGDSCASVVSNCGSDYASDSGSSGESIFTVTKCSMGTKRDLLPFDSRSLYALLGTKCESDCTSGSSDDSIFKGNECSMGIEKGIDKLLKRRPLSTRKLIGKRPSGLESALNFEFSKRRKLNESDSGDSIL